MQQVRMSTDLRNVLEAFWPIVKQMRAPLVGQEGACNLEMEESIKVWSEEEDPDGTFLKVQTFTCPRGNEHSLQLNLGEVAPNYGESISADEVFYCFGYTPEDDDCSCQFSGDRYEEYLKEQLAGLLNMDPWLPMKLAAAKGDTCPPWLIEGVLEKGKMMALFGPPKTGKSLLALEWAIQLCENRKRVLYLDEENDLWEIYERARDMGKDLSKLRMRLAYKSFTGLKVDTEQGAEAILEAASGYDLVIFDSYAKFFSRGSQSDDAAINRAYDLTIKPLKARGTSIIRLDHTGHGEANRPAGSVQKLADVDHNWLIKAESASGRERRKVILTHTENRTGRGDTVVTMDRLLEPLRHERRDKPAEAIEETASGQESTEEAVTEVVEALDSIGAPTFWSGNQCITALREAGKGKRRDLVHAAQKRRQTSIGQ